MSLNVSQAVNTATVAADQTVNSVALSVNQAANNLALTVSYGQANTINSIILGEPAGSSVISNIVFISENDFAAAVIAGTLIQSTYYVKTGVVILYQTFDQTFDLSFG